MSAKSCFSMIILVSHYMEVPSFQSCYSPKQYLFLYSWTILLQFFLLYGKQCYDEHFSHNALPEFLITLLG